MKSSCIRLCSAAALVYALFVFFPVPVEGQEVTMDTLTSRETSQEPGETDQLYRGYNPSGEQGDSTDIQVTALKDKAAAERWWYGWLAGYSAATAGQGIVYFTSDNKTLRQDMALGAATTFLGAMGQLITPVFSKQADYPSYREYASGEKSLPSEQAAELLKSLAAREKEGRSWKTHAIAGVVNLGSGLITWLGYKRTFMDGLENFAINTVITEAQIWTQPMKAVRDYEKYTREAGPGVESMTSRREGEWSWSVYPGGFYVRYVF
jgi:hypothetical protein